MMKIQASTTLRIEPMRTIQNILFPVDFSPSCAAMAAFVKRAASIFGAGVMLVHIFDLYSHDAFQLYVRPPSELAEEQEILARQKLDSFLKSEFPVGECPRILLSGDAATQIAQLARTDRFDLIIMPTHAGVFRRTLLGSTTAKVLNDTDCPVLTTQHAETIAPRRLEHREWVCAIGARLARSIGSRRAHAVGRKAGSSMPDQGAAKRGWLAR